MDATRADEGVIEDSPRTEEGADDIADADDGRWRSENSSASSSRSRASSARPSDDAMMLPANGEAGQKGGGAAGGRRAGGRQRRTGRKGGEATGGGSERSGDNPDAQHTKQIRRGDRNNDRSAQNDRIKKAVDSSQSVQMRFDDRRWDETTS